MPSKTTFLHNPYGVLENAIRTAMASSKGRPFATIPLTLGQAIRRRAAVAFTTKRFTFTQLMKAVLMIPELAWFRPKAGIERELLSPETLAMLDSTEPAVLTGCHATAIAVESLLSSGQWQLMETTPHLLFQRTAHYYNVPPAQLSLDQLNARPRILRDFGTKGGHQEARMRSAHRQRALDHL